MNGSVRPCSAAQEATWAWWCWTAMRRSGGCWAIAYFVDRYSGWRSWTTISGSRARSRAEVGEAVGERPVRGQVLEVAVVRCDVGPPAAGEGERVLQLGADRQQRPRGRDRQRERLGRVPPAAPDDRRPSGDDPRDRVVVAGPDLPVVDEERVGEAGEALRGVGIVGGQRLVGEVARGEDEGPPDGLEEEMVERGVGQEDPEAGVPGRNRRGQARLAPAAGDEEDDRAFRAVQQASLDGADTGERLRGRHVGDHDRERLGPATLAVAQRSDGRLVGGVAGEVIAAEALHGDDSSRRGGRRPRRRGRRRRGPWRRPRPWAGRRDGGRRRGRRRARRGSGGLRGPCTRRRRTGRGGTAASWSGRGRTGAGR